MAKVSTMPRVGFSARFAIPVLNDIDVMSKIAVPVVSAPVPAVVGTEKEKKKNCEFVYDFSVRVTLRFY